MPPQSPPARALGRAAVGRVAGGCRRSSWSRVPASVIALYVLPVGRHVPKEKDDDEAVEPVDPTVTKPPADDAEALLDEEEDLGPAEDEASGLESDEAVNRYRMPDTRNREMFAIAD